MHGLGLKNLSMLVVAGLGQGDEGGISYFYEKLLDFYNFSYTVVLGLLLQPCMRCKMKPFGQSPKKESYPENKILYIKDFIEEGGKTVGVLGIVYPEQIEVRMDMTYEKVNDANRSEFETMRADFNLERGAILRLPYYKTGENEAVADKIDVFNVLTRNAEETKQKFIFSYASVDLYTPKALRQQREDIRKELKGTVPDDELEFNVDERMLKACQNQRRYDGAVRFYFPSESIVGDLDEVMPAVENYFCDLRFGEVVEEGGLFPREQPGLWLRALNPQGEVLAVYDVSPSMLYHAGGVIPEERITVVHEELLSMLGQFPDAQFNLLPYSKVDISQCPLTVTYNNDEIQAFRHAQGMSYEFKLNDNGERYFEARAMEAVVEFADNGLVNNFFIPGGAKNVAVARLDAKGQENTVMSLP